MGGKVSQTEYLAQQGTDTFADIDENSDQKLQPEEWHQFWQGSAAAARGGNKDLDNYFIDLDTDNSGFISRAEYGQMAELFHEEAIDGAFDEQEEEGNPASQGGEL